jgi:quercetin dioxygenase-like cupin family protein
MIPTCPGKPRRQVDSRTPWSEAIAEAYGTQQNTADSGPAPGMHRTDTVDVVTVVSGELHAILETGEIVLRAGDSIVQRGTMHAWSNR